MLQTLNIPDISLLIKALDFAAVKHRDQRRKDSAKTPYINHPIALVHVLITKGMVVDPKVLCAAVLHDTIEDTATTAEELGDNFGKPIRDIVLEVSDDQSLSSAERKRRQIIDAPHISYEAKLVKLADKISNIRDVITAWPMGWSEQRRREYLDWSWAVVDGIRGTNGALEEEFDRLYAFANDALPEFRQSA